MKTLYHISSAHRKKQKIVKTVKNITLLVNKNEFHEWWYKAPPACHRLMLETELSFINELNFLFDIRYPPVVKTGTPVYGEFVHNSIFKKQLFRGSPSYLLLHYIDPKCIWNECIRMNNLEVQKCIDICNKNHSTNTNLVFDHNKLTFSENNFYRDGILYLSINEKANPLQQNDIKIMFTHYGLMCGLPCYTHNEIYEDSVFITVEYSNLDLFACSICKFLEQKTYSFIFLKVNELSETLLKIIVCTLGFIPLFSRENDSTFLLSNTPLVICLPQVYQYIFMRPFIVFSSETTG